jgi:hypothetical protein
MPQAALNALLVEYQHQADWLEAQAADLASGARRIIAKGVGGDVDLTDVMIEEYKHKAANMRAVILAFERLHAKGI